MFLRKFRLYFIILAFGVPLFFFAATGFSSSQDPTVWKADTQKPYLSVERTAGWQTKMRILSRR